MFLVLKSFHLHPRSLTKILELFGQDLTELLQNYFKNYVSGAQILSFASKITHKNFGIIWSRFDRVVTELLQKLCFWCSNPFICIQDHSQKFWNYLVKI